MRIDDCDTFLTLAEALKAEGWAIVKFENLDGPIELTIVPVEGEKGAE
jgi:hypothetical protein